MNNVHDCNELLKELEFIDRQLQALSPINEIIQALSTRRQLIDRDIDNATSPSLREILAAKKARLRQNRC